MKFQVLHDLLTQFFEMMSLRFQCKASHAKSNPVNDPLPDGLAVGRGIQVPGPEGFLVLDEFIPFPVVELSIRDRFIFDLKDFRNRTWRFEFASLKRGR